MTLSHYVQPYKECVISTSPPHVSCDVSCYSGLVCCVCHAHLVRCRRLPRPHLRVRGDCRETLWVEFGEQVQMMMRIPPLIHLVSSQGADPVFLTGVIIAQASPWQQANQTLPFYKLTNQKKALEIFQQVNQFQALLILQLHNQVM